MPSDLVKAFVPSIVDAGVLALFHRIDLLFGRSLSLCTSDGIVGLQGGRGSACSERGCGRGHDEGVARESERL